MIEAVKTKNVFIYDVADITVECPNCGLEYKEYGNYDDDWRIVECDRCGKKYKYRYEW